MRKKYLSALLFGALLFASAGTFTSCKDYDDDINNLQEQINTINTTLTELKGQIGTAGVSSVTFDEATGVLTVVDGKGTTTYKINTVAESMVEAEIKDGILTINGEEIGAVVGEVTVENGKLMVDGKEVASLGGESNVVLVKNEDNQTCTLTVGDQTVTLPLNADATTVPTVEFKSPSLKTWNVNWGVAASDITFGDATYKAGSLLLGGMTDNAVVTVKPIAYDLSAQKLALVDIDGNFAPVKVVPTVDEESGVVSRTVSPNGEWKLNLEMLDTVTEENIATAFTKEVNGVDQNLKYALTVNGTRVTGYNIVIDTQTKNESEANEAIKKEAYKGAEATVEAGETVVSIADFTTVESARIVAATMALDDITAEAAGVKVEGMKVTVPAGFTGESFNVKLTVLDVTGAQSEHKAVISVKASTVEEESRVDQVEVAISAEKSFVVPFGDVFSKLDANTAIAIASAKITTADNNFFALNMNSFAAAEDGIYSVADNDSILFSKKDDGTGYATIGLTSDADVRSIKNVKVTLHQNASVKYITGAQNPANLYGTFDLTLSLLDKSGNVLKKVIIPVKVVKPEFSDFFAKNEYATWNGDEFTRVLSKANLEINKSTDKLFVAQENVTLLPSAITYQYKVGDKENVSLDATSSGADALKKAGVLEAIEKDSDLNKIKNASATVTATYANFATVDMAGSTKDEVINLTSTFTMNFKAMLSDITVKYYKNNVASDEAVVYNIDKTSKGVSQSNPYILGYQKTAAADEKAGTPDIYNGIGFVYNGKVYDLIQTSIEGVTVGMNASNAEISTAASVGVAYAISLSENSVGAGLNSDSDPFVTGKSSLAFNSTMVTGDKGALEFQLVDELGIQNGFSIKYVKVDEQSPVDHQ